MGDPEQHHIPFKERRFRNARFRRGVFLVPALFTSANLLCGYFAVVAALMGTTADFDRAAKAIGLAILFDSLDGRLARLLGANTDFGVQFDSLADVVSFGVAPAVLAFAWGVRSLAIAGTQRGELLSDMGCVCCLGFLVCCGWRLARFNVQGMAAGGSMVFGGVASTGGAGIVV